MTLPELPLPHDSYRWNKAILGAFKKGMLAQQSGLPVTACPYRPTWTNRFVFAWSDGWRWAEKKTGVSAIAGEDSK